MEKEKLQEIKDLLIVVDMVNGFVREGNMASPNIETIIPRIEKLVERYIDEGKAIAYVKDTHEKDAIEFERYPEHCVKGTTEAEMVDELRKYEHMALVYEKNSTCAMFAKDFLDDLNKMKNLNRIVVTGCCTDICVTNLVIPLRNYLDQENRNVEIIVPQDAVETYDAPTHKADEWNKKAFEFMEQGGITLVKTLERK